MTKWNDKSLRELISQSGALPQGSSVNTEQSDKNVIVWIEFGDEQASATEQIKKIATTLARHIFADCSEFDCITSIFLLDGPPPRIVDAGRDRRISITRTQLTESAGGSDEAFFDSLVISPDIQAVEEQLKDSRLLGTEAIFNLVVWAPKRATLFILKDGQSNRSEADIKRASIALSQLIFQNEASVDELCIAFMHSIRSKSGRRVMVSRDDLAQSSLESLIERITVSDGVVALGCGPMDVGEMHRI